MAEIEQSTLGRAQPSVEDEATKRNTDCVYFLASPLTCKKASECEYRHSEYARVNPRDCRYWLNGTCLNPKCPFRHPPLEGLLGTKSAVSNGKALPLPQAVAPSPVAGSQSKQVPCIFFRKGLCLKGDKCSFLHGPNHGATKPPQVTLPVSEGAGPKGMFGVPQRSSQEPEVYQPGTSNSFEYTDANSTSKILIGQPKPEAVAERVVMQSEGFNDESSSYKSNTISPIFHRSNIHTHQLEAPDGHMMHIDKDADDSHRESSPGFDVLVDDELAEDHYYDEEQYGITRGDIEGRNADYFGVMPDANHEMFHDPQCYNGYNRLRSPRDQSRRSSERISRRPCISDSICQSDLRYRLEQKRGSNLRLCISKDNARVNHEDRRSNDSRKDSRLVSSLESSLSSRLRGRIHDRKRSMLRVRVRVRDSGSDRDTERGRTPSRTSPGPIPLRDRIGVRVHDEFKNERNSRRYGTIKERLVDGRGECSGPSDVKGNISVKDRLMSGQESFSLGKRKNTGEHEKFDSDLSFDGPKPLSEILKRKKKPEMIKSPGNSNNDASVKTGINQEEPKPDTHVSEEKIGPDQDHISRVTNTDQVDRIIADEGLEDQNLEGYGMGEDGEEEYYYEEDGGEYTVEEARNGEGEYPDGGNGDEFENKMGGYGLIKSENEGQLATYF